jgi:N-acetylneuraminic acid mutarotase
MSRSRSCFSSFRAPHCPLASLIILMVFVLGLILSQPAQAVNDWSLTGYLEYGRRYHSATLLPDGRVLVVGGDIFQSYEIYNPASGIWSPAGSLPYPYNAAYHTATRLKDGQVLVAGGLYENSALSSCQLFNPAGDTWTGTGDLLLARGKQTATLLPNGQVLVAGGYNKDSLEASSSAELYDPAKGAWLSAGNTPFQHINHAAVLLANGKVLVIAGLNNGGEVDIFYPATKTWSNNGSLPNQRWDHTATLLPNGKVLIAGGSGPTGDWIQNSCLLYDPNTGTATDTDSLHYGRSGHTATLLRNGKVLVAGGTYYNRDTKVSNDCYISELYDPATGTWTNTGLLNVARIDHTATLLDNGKVLAAGGYDGTAYLASAEIYNTAQMNLGFLSLLLLE